MEYGTLPHEVRFSASRFREMGESPISSRLRPPIIALMRENLRMWIRRAGLLLCTENQCREQERIIPRND